MNKLICLYVILLSLGLQNVFAQNREVSGVVTSAEDGLSIPGVSVILKGTVIGTTTDFEGKYSINVPSEHNTLVFSFVGMKMQQKVITSSILDVVMETESIGVDEVVVTALGISREKKSLGYSVSEVKAEELLGAKEVNIVSAMAGKVAGVQVSSSSGQAGSSARIVIRGNSSINYNNQPLFVIDGVPFENTESSIKSNLRYGGGTNSGVDIDPNNIESMTVLKGASASALYGSKAANGVVLITTKSGKKGMPLSISISHTLSVDKIIETPLQNTWAQGDNSRSPDGSLDFVFMDGDLQKSALSWGPKIDDVPGAKRYNRWDAFQKGITNETNISVRGGGENGSYFASYSNLDQSGTLEPIEFKRSNFLAKFSLDLSERLKISTSVNYVNTRAFRLMEGNDEASFMNSFLGSPQTWNMNPATDENGNQRVYRDNGRNNYMWLLDNSGNPSERNRFLNTFNVQYKILDNLTFIARVGQDYYSSKEEFYVNKGATGSHASGTFNTYNRTFHNLNSDIMLNYDKQINQDLSIDAMLGMNIVTTDIEENGIDGKQFIVPSFYNSNNCMSQLPWTNLSEKRGVSYYTSLTASYKNFLFYTFTGRLDMSSTLPTDENKFFYSSNSLGLIFSELIDEESILNFGKLRVSYAQVGNDAPAYSTTTGKINPEPYDPYRGYVQFPLRGIGSFIESNLQGNMMLKPEMTSEFEVGLEAKFFNNRLGIDASYYNKVSTDQIVKAPVDNATGFDERMMNIGKMTNKGVELMLYATPIKTNDFSWDVTLNWSKNVNKVNRISENVKAIQLEGFAGEGPYIVEGEPYGVIWGTKITRDEHGQKVVDVNTGRWLVDATKPGIVGDVNPDWIGGFRNTLSYKGLTLSAFLDIKVGGEVFNLDEHYLMYYGMSTLTEDRPESMQIVLEGPTGSFDQNGELVLTGSANAMAVNYKDLYQDQLEDLTEEMVQKADYVKLREISLAYSLPSSILKRLKYIKGMNVSLTGRNLWMKTDDSFTGADPEGSLAGSGNGQGIINYMMPSTKTYTIGLKLTF